MRFGGTPYAWRLDGKHGRQASPAAWREGMTMREDVERGNAQEQTGVGQRRPGHRAHGFSLVEIMTVVAVIGLLTAMVMPALARARRAARVAALANNFRSAVTAIELYSIENGGYPAETPAGQAPAGIEGYVSRLEWDQPTPGGGQWDWEADRDGVRAALIVRGIALQTEDLEAVDRRLDDGNLDTGAFRAGPTNSCTYVIE
jgi:prepilin-type N-terminal cleavage/methylation domain-containing protein